MSDWRTLLLAIGGVALFGGLGSVARLMFSQWHGKLPWGILLSNTLASIAAGLVFTVNQGGNPLFALTAVFVATGFAGGLSTFSSWAAQTVHLFTGGRNRAGIANLLLNLVIPSIGAIAGIVFGAFLLK